MAERRTGAWTRTQESERARSCIPAVLVFAARAPTVFPSLGSVTVCADRPVFPKPYTRSVTLPAESGTGTL